MGTVHAADTWSDPLPGVRLLRRTTGAPQRVFAMQIDLCRDGVSLRATKSDERQRTASSFGDHVGADAVINGDFFSYATYSTSGLSIGAGEAWPGTSDGGGNGVVAFGRGRAEVRRPADEVGTGEAWMRNVVSGHPGLVDGGVALAEDSGDLCTTRHPRTVAGISADGRTLVLAVVDGRSSTSVGMRCTELAALLAELGAHQAINLDGGGSSTMWMRGEGVLNSPSDGGQRVTANHLGLFASGTGEPGSCDRSREEATEHGDAIGASTTTDIDGDGRPDLCARAAAGIRCHLATDEGFSSETIVGPELSDANGWDDRSHYATLRMGDVDGDGLADLCARDSESVKCWPSTGDGFGEAIDGPPLSNASGWGGDPHFGTIRMADLDGDGRDDICARAVDGLHCWRSRGDGFDPLPVLAGLSNEAGFDAASRYGTIRMADLDADARTDVCARSEAGMRCWKSTGDGFGPAIDGPAWSDANGFGRVEYWSTIRLADLDGDRHADLCVRHSGGMSCHLGDGEGFGDEIVGPAWSDENGWWDYSNYSTVRTADLDADGDLDMCARANAGVVCSLFEDGAFGESFDGPRIADDAGWNSMSRFATLRFVDLDADGRADLCARDATGVACWRSLGASFEATPVAGPGWGDDNGWASAMYFETLRASPVQQRCVVDERCGDGSDDDCDGEIDEGCDPGDVTTGDDGDSASEGDDGVASEGTGGGSGEADEGALPTTFGEDGEGQGCGCTSASGGRAWLVLLVALPWRRARSRRRSASR